MVIASRIAGSGIRHCALCDRTIAGAIGMLFLTALLIVLLAAFAFALIGIHLLSVLGLYGLRFSDRRSEMDLRDPDTQLFFFSPGHTCHSRIAFTLFSDVTMTWCGGACCAVEAAAI